MPRTIPREVARRYLLGRQGLWPGRRWSGKEGAAAAIRAIGALQLDPVSVVARSHDVVLWSRVEGYEPAMLDQLAYRERRFFDYGGHLDLYPMEELPFWALHMRRRRVHGRWVAVGRDHAEAIGRVREAVRERGPLGSRDLEGEKVTSYRAGHDAGLALYYLWIVGELMTAGRRGGDRLYDLRERVAPPEHDRWASDEEAEPHFERQALRLGGLTPRRAFANHLYYVLGRVVPPAEAEERLGRLIESGAAARVAVEGVKEPYYVPADELPLIDELEAGRLPAAWRPLGATTYEEVVLLSPLDNLLHNRVRTSALFGFDYVWEIYKKPAQRRYGRYTLPVLYGEHLVARLEPRLDRKARAFGVEAFWPEDEALLHDERFAAAFARGLARFAAFNGAERVSLEGVPEPLRSSGQVDGLQRV